MTRSSRPPLALRHVRRVLTAAVFAGIVAAASGATAASAALAAADGSLLTNETFENSTVKDSRWQSLGDACLTAATQGSTSPAGVSNLSGCSKVQDSVTNLGSGSDGYLQLTDNSAWSSAAAVLNRAFPSSAGLTMTFDEYQYAASDTGLGPADGIGFFLTDGSYTLTQAGPAGGSLGYAAYAGNVSGIPHGYLGLGLDVYGNYEYQPYVGPNCPQSSAFAPNSVALRGSGDGVDGYCLIDSAPYADLQNAPSTAPGGTQGTLQQVTVTVSPTTAAEPYPTVTTSINGTQVLRAKMTSPVPATLKLGFAASTGGGHEVHMIRNVTVSSIDALGGINLTKTVDHSDNTGTSTTIFTEGDTIPYSFLVTNTGAEALTNVTVDDPKVSDVSCPATTLQPADSFTCTGRYGPLAAADVASGTFTNTATAIGTDTDDNIQTSTSSADAPTYRSAPLEISKQITGNASAAVDPATAYTIRYSYPSGPYRPAPAAISDAPATYPAGSGVLTVTAGGSTTTSTRIPTGATVTLDEEAPPQIAASSWKTPRFSQNPVTIGSDAPATVTIVNTIEKDPGTVDWTKVDSVTGQLLPGSRWRLTLPDGTTESVVDNGANDTAMATGRLEVTNLPWATYTLVETEAPADYTRSTKQYTFTIDADHLTVNLGAIANTHTPSATPTPTTAPTPPTTAPTPPTSADPLATGSGAPASGAAVNTGGTMSGGQTPWVWGALLAVGALSTLIMAVLALRSRRTLDG